ncbi:MAG: rhodanese-like domain-containing protein [Planctomycetia bacterium]|nr:rhodanese-like domain-containing protein [Planctomycetia bacterium]
MNLRDRYIMLMLFILAFHLLRAKEISLSAQEENKPLPDLKEIEVSGPYCGIYSLVSCLGTFGIEPKIEELLVPEFVGSFQGSSNQEIIEAAQKYGCYAKTYSKLSWNDLKNATSPMILHVRSSYSDRMFNHWVAYLGCEGDFARIIDFPHPMTPLHPAELLAQWDGTAIEISNKPITQNLAISSLINYFLLIMFVFGGGAVFRYVVTYPQNVCPSFSMERQFKQIMFQTSFILGLLFIVGVLYHTFSEIGFLKNPTAVAEVTRRYYSVDIPEILYPEMVTIIAEQKVPIFDSRYVRDFQKGTIPGAKSLSINSILSERQQILAEVPKNQRVVVFCQSEGCGFADEVAQFLKFNGYHDVVIYRGGFREWSQRQKEL